MYHDEEHEFFSGVVRTSQIIVAAMVLTALGFLVVVAVKKPDQPPQQLVLSYLAIAVTAADLLAWMIVPAIVLRTCRRQIEGGTYKQTGTLPPGQTPEQRDRAILVEVFQTRLIIACALLQGIVFLNLIAYMLEGQLLNVLAAACLMGMILFHFPTSGGLQSWVARQKEEIELARSLGVTASRRYM